jgi:hypothetical protein
MTEGESPRGDGAAWRVGRLIQPFSSDGLASLLMNIPCLTNLYFHCFSLAIFNFRKYSSWAPESIRMVARGHRS